MIYWTIGSMLEISSKETAVEVNKTLELYAQDSQWVYTGYTDIEEEGHWVIHNTDKELNWQNWIPGKPDNFGNADCATMDTFNFKISDNSCQKQFIPVCNIAEVNSVIFEYIFNCSHLQEYKLSGLPTDDIIDVVYTAKYK